MGFERFSLHIIRSEEALSLRTKANCSRQNLATYERSIPFIKPSKTYVLCITSSHSPSPHNLPSWFSVKPYGQTVKKLRWPSYEFELDQSQSRKLALPCVALRVRLARALRWARLIWSRDFVGWTRCWNCWNSNRCCYKKWKTDKKYKLQKRKLASCLSSDLTSVILGRKPCLDVVAVTLTTKTRHFVIQWNTSPWEN